MDILPHFHNLSAARVHRDLLLVRPLRQRDESDYAYLVRLSAANALAPPGRLWQALRRSHATADLLALKMHLAEPSWGEMDSERSGSQISSDVPDRWLAGNRLHGLRREDFLQAEMSWCPMCLASQGYIRREWRLKLCCVCIEHRRLLSDSCPACGTRQHMERADLMRCPCGARLDAGVQPPVSAAFAHLTAFLSAAVFDACRATDGGRASASDWVKLIRYLGAFSTASPRPAKPGQPARLSDLRVAAPHVERAARILSNWPHGLHSLLDRARSAEESSNRLPHAFGPIYAVLYRQLSAPGFQFLRDEFETYLHDHWEGLLCKRNRSLNASTVEAHPRLSVKQIAVLANATIASTERHLSTGTIDTWEMRSTTGRRIRTLHASTVASLSSKSPALSESVTLNAAVRALHLPASRVRQLVAGGLLASAPADADCGHRAGTPWEIRACAVDAMNSCVRDLPGQAPLRGVRLRKAVRDWHLDPLAFCTLVQAISSGRVVAWSSGPGAALGTATLDRRIMKSFIDALRRRGEGTLSVDQAARALNIKQEVAYQLVKKGLLSSVCEASRGRRIRPEDLRGFREQYVSLAEIARTSSESPKGWMTRMPLRPVCGPMLDGVRQYFYRRVEVAAWSSKVSA